MSKIQKLQWCTIKLVSCLLVADTNYTNRKKQFYSKSLNFLDLAHYGSSCFIPETHLIEMMEQEAESGSCKRKTCNNKRNLLAPTDFYFMHEILLKYVVRCCIKWCKTFGTTLFFAFLLYLSKLNTSIRFAWYCNWAET